jgi:GntR family transcriptional regulator/MocR family aminotransferase
MRRLYRQRRDALQEALERCLDGAAWVDGASAGMHLALRFADPALDDVVVAERLLEQGIVVHPLSAHAVGNKVRCRGLMLGYAQVPVERMDGLARRVAQALQ